jgi:hypothetical protein
MGYIGLVGTRDVRTQSDRACARAQSVPSPLVPVPNPPVPCLLVPNMPVWCPSPGPSPPVPMFSRCPMRAQSMPSPCPVPARAQD